MDRSIQRVRQSKTRAVTMDGARWIVYPEEETSFIGAAMSSAQFVHMNAPVVAVQREDRMEYLDEEGEVGWTSNLAWPRANLEMVRLLDMDERETKRA